MTDQVIIVPKLDEVTAVLHVFGLERGTPASERLSNDVQLWRVPVAGDTTIALLGRQTNTNAGPLTLSVLHHENPGQIYLLGTALGNPTKAPLGSVFAASGVLDILERRPSPNDPYGWQPAGPHAHRELSDAAASYTQDHFWNPENIKRFHVDLSLPPYLRGSLYDRTVEQVSAYTPQIAAEQILSGNEYIMMTTGPGVDEHILWRQFSPYRAYDMEAAGFRLAAESSATPWLVVRGVSDHGSHDTRIDRTFATAAAAKLLRDFLEAGAHEPDRIRAPRPRFSGASILARWKGEFRGYMGYRDDEGNLVVYEEVGQFQPVGQVIAARVRSTVEIGDVRQPVLDYVVDLTVAHEEFAAGTWVNDQGDDRYFGSIAGELCAAKGSLGGLWTGTHGEGIRVGRFSWYSMSSEVGRRSFQTEADRSRVLEAFVRLFDPPPPPEVAT